MNKLILIIGILLISSVSAVTIYSGETHILEVEEQYDYYSIVGNSSPVYLEVSQIGNEIIITFSKYSVEDTFEIIFFNKEKEVITKYSGGTRTIYEDRNITEYIDVPHYIETEIEVEKEADPEIIKEIPAMTLFLIYFLVGLILWLIYKHYQKSNRIERRLKEEQNE